MTFIDWLLLRGSPFSVVRKGFIALTFEMLGFLANPIENYLVFINEESIACIDFLLRKLSCFVVIVPCFCWQSVLAFKFFYKAVVIMSI